MNAAKTKAGASRTGFTLMETVIAIGVVAVLLTTFLAVFGPASQDIRRAISAQDANRLQSALERELQILRDGTDSTYGTAFEKAFDWILNSGDSSKAVILYNYRGDPKSIRADGSLEPYAESDGQSGRDFILQPGVRRRGDADPDLEQDLETIEGQAFYVHMTQLIFDNGELVQGAAGEIVGPYSGGQSYDSAEDYPEAVILYSADFYALRSNSLQYLESLDLSDSNGDGRPDGIGRPLFSRNLAVRR